MNIHHSRKLALSSFALLALLMAGCGQSPNATSSSPTGNTLVQLPGGRLSSRDFGTATYDNGYGLAANATGVYVVGFTDGSLDGPNKGNNDAFVRKYDGGVV
jgi:hypothetical protein